MKNKHTGSFLSKTFNLFSPSPLLFPSPQPPTNKCQKQQIQLVFHHPNLLYLSNHKQKCRDQVAREVEERIVKKIQIKKLNSTGRTQCDIRPKTSDPWAPRNQENQNRCQTSKEFKRTKGSQSKLNSDKRMEILGSSKFLSPIVDNSVKELIQKQCQNKLVETPLSLFPIQPSQKQLDRKYSTSASQKKGSAKINMNMIFQKQYLKYNTNKTASKFERSKKLLNMFT